MNRLLALAALVVFAALFAGSSAGGDGPNGNGGKPPGGDNPCGPSEHGVYNSAGVLVGCEPNGDGGGNCGQNQSGKGDKTGNGGDKGYGHKDGCAEESTPPASPPPPNPPPTSPPPTRPPTSPPSVTPSAVAPPASTPKADAPPPASTQPTTTKAPTVKASSKVKLPTGDFKKDKCVKIKKGALYSCKIGNKRVIVVPGSY